MNERFYPGGGLRRLIEKATAKVGRPGIIILEKRYEGTEVEFHGDTFFEFCQALVDLATDEDWRKMTITVDMDMGRSVRYISGRDYKTRKEFEAAQRHAVEHDYRMERDPVYRREQERLARAKQQMEAAESSHRERQRIESLARRAMNAATSMASSTTAGAMDGAEMMRTLKAMEATGMMGASMRHGMDPGALVGDRMAVGMVSSGKKKPAVPEVDLTKIMGEVSADVKRLA